VTLDEAVSHRLRSVRAAAAYAKPASTPSAPPAVTSSASVSSLPSRPVADQAMQAIDRISGNVGLGLGRWIAYLRKLRQLGKLSLPRSRNGMPSG
jgi:hypothetical protein